MDILYQLPWSVLYDIIYIYISEKIEVLLGSMLYMIINLASTMIIIVLFLSFRKVLDKIFSKEPSKKLIPTRIHEKITANQTSVSGIPINIEENIYKKKNIYI